MPLQNRVQPDGTIVAAMQRGTLFGNRGGPFHDEAQMLLPRQWHSKQWICCVLEFKGRRRKLMQPGRYTELFFLDEATALGAGHRPCFECRRDAAMDFATKWNVLRGATGRAMAQAMDEVLHGERLDEDGHYRTHPVAIEQLSDHVFIRLDGRPARLAKDTMQFWSLDGYEPSQPRPKRGRVEMLTPPSTAAILGAGYRPMLHKTAAT
jgi:hypothetical protein